MSFDKTRDTTAFIPDNGAELRDAPMSSESLIPEPARRRSSPAARSALIVLACVVALSVPLQVHFVRNLSPDVHSDLYSPWMGTRALLHHVDPYSPTLTARIQGDMYGHPLAPGDPHDPEAFVYPPWVAFPLAPFTFVAWPSVEWLFAILTPLVILATLWAWMRFCTPGFARAASVAICVLVLACWPAVWGCYQRQPSLFVIAAIAFSLLLFRQARDVASGILLALATVKPQLVLLIAAWLFALALGHRRWRFVTSFLASLASLVGASALLFPGSIMHWIHAAIAYTHAAGKVSLLTHLLGPRLGLFADLALLAALGLRLWKLLPSSSDTPAFVNAAALILAVTTCLIPGNAWLLFNNLLLVPAVLLLFSLPAGTQFPQLLQTLAGLALLLALLVTPICAGIGALTGYRFDLVMPPFLLNYLLPIPLTAAFFFFLPAANQMPE